MKFVPEGFLTRPQERSAILWHADLLSLGLEARLICFWSNGAELMADERMFAAEAEANA